MFGFQSQLQNLWLSDGGGEANGKTGAPVHGTETSPGTKFLAFLPQGTSNDFNFPMFFHFKKIKFYVCDKLPSFIIFQNKYKPGLAQQQTQVHSLLRSPTKKME